MCIQNCLWSSYFKRHITRRGLQLKKEKMNLYANRPTRGCKLGSMFCIVEFLSMHASIWNLTLVHFSQSRKVGVSLSRLWIEPRGSLFTNTVNILVSSLYPMTQSPKEMSSQQHQETPHGSQVTVWWRSFRDRMVNEKFMSLFRTQRKVTAQLQGEHWTILSSWF